MMLGEGTIEQPPLAIVGAGPCDIELITVKGRRLLDEADTIVPGVNRSRRA